MKPSFEEDFPGWARTLKSSGRPAPAKTADNGFNLGGQHGSSVLSGLILLTVTSHLNWRQTPRIMRLIE
jgi:hypothetical protein